MKLARSSQSPSEAIDFYEQALTTLGAVCERTWHDRLNLIAEGVAARLWNPDGSLHEADLHFAPADAISARDPDREVFPGCPLTFKITEALRPAPVVLERFFLADPHASRPPETLVAEKLWRSQFPETKCWRLIGPLIAVDHFSLIALIRCEIQAMDQSWAAHRVAFSLTDGSLDDDLAEKIAFQNTNESAPSVDWPIFDPSYCQRLLARALEIELTQDIASARARQQNSLRRELDRIDDYFKNYQRELSERAARSRAESSRTKVADRLGAAKVEHERRRFDQISRHEIRVIPHIDALLLAAEKAWRGRIEIDATKRSEPVAALFVPRLRRWKRSNPSEI
jgi:hypothetical protein